MKNKIDIRGIRDGAMMTALTVIFMLLSLYVPLFSFIGMFLSGIPLAVLYARDGIMPSVLSAVCSFLIMFVFTGDLFNVFTLVVAYAVPGLVAGICLKKRLNFFRSVLFTGAAFLAGILLEVLMIKLFMGGIDQMFTELFSGLGKTVEEALKSVSGAGSEEIAQTAKSFADTIIYMAKLYFPSVLIVSSFFCAYLMCSFAGFILKRLKLCNVKTVPFYMLRAPKSMSIAAVLLYILSFFINPEGMVSAAFLNILFVIYALVSVCGFSFIDYKFKGLVKKGYLRALIYIAVFIFGGMFITLFINICLIIGIFDSTMNFRRISAVNEDDNILTFDDKNLKK